MSTKCSYAYHAVGSYQDRTEFGVHVYYECLDRTYRVQVTAFGLDAPALRIPRRLAWFVARVWP